METTKRPQYNVGYSVERFGWCVFRTQLLKSGAFIVTLVRGPYKTEYQAEIRARWLNQFGEKS